jgi:hypothetical protein
VYRRGYDSCYGVIQRKGSRWLWQLFEDNDIPCAGEYVRSFKEAKDMCDGAANAYRYHVMHFYHHYATQTWKDEYDRVSREQDAAERNLPNC